MEKRDTLSLSRYQKFYETRHDSPEKAFGIKQNCSTGNRDTPCLSRYQKFFEAQNKAPTKFVGTVRQNFFDG